MTSPVRHGALLRRPRRFAACCRAPMAGLLIAILPSLADGQIQATELSIQSKATVTNNGAGASDGIERSDLLLSVRPAMRYVRNGAGLSVRADAELDMIVSARDTQRDRVLPRGHLDAQGVLIDRLLFLDSSVDVYQSEVDPFGVRAGAGSTQNSRTTGVYRVSPRLSYDISPRTALLARYDASWARNAGSTQGDVSTRRGYTRFQVRPQPLGASLEWSSEDTDYTDAATSDLRIDRVNATVNLALDTDWVVGAMLGDERSELGSSNASDRTYGLRVYWTPSPRTEVAASLDRQFFGTGWNVSARHRTPRMVFLIRAQREPASASSQAGGRGFSGSLAGFLDAVVQARSSNAAQSSGGAAALGDGGGSQIAFQGAGGTPSTYPQLRSAGEGTWTYLGTRTTMSLSLFMQELRQLSRSDGTLVAIGPAAADSRQRGTRFGWSRRLSPVTSVDVSATWSRIDGLAMRDGDLTREASLSAGVSRDLSPQTRASFGLLVRRVSSNVSTVNSYDETSGFVGMAHRF